MVRYAYQARAMDGTMVEGVWAADSEMQVLDEMREQGLFVVRLRERRSFWHRLPLLFPAGIDAALFFRQLAVLLQSGMTLHESLAALAGEGSREKKLLSSLRRGIEEGQSFSEVLRQHPGFFPSIAADIAGVGEASGQLSEMMQQLADWLAAERRTREKMKTVLTYPLFLFAETLGVTVFLTLVVLPAFADLFLSMDAELPLPTRLLLGWSRFLQEHGFALLLGGGVLGLLAYACFRRPEVRRRLDRFRLWGPFFGRLQREVVWMKVFRALSVLVHCAIPLDEAVLGAASAAGNQYVKERLCAAAPSIQQGFPLSEVLAGEATLPRMLHELLRTGEAAGRLPEMLGEGAAYAAMMAEHHAARLQAMAEPAAYLVIFAFVGGIVAAVALPWLDMMTLFV